MRNDQKTSKGKIKVQLIFPDTGLYLQSSKAHYATVPVVLTLSLPLVSVSLNEIHCSKSNMYEAHMPFLRNLSKDQGTIKNDQKQN